MRTEWSGFFGSLAGFLVGAGLVFVLMQSTSNIDSSESGSANLVLAEALEKFSLQVAAMKGESLVAPISDQARIERTSHPSSSSPDLNLRLQSLESALLQLTEVLGDIARSSSSSGTSSVPLVAIGGPVKIAALEALNGVGLTERTLQHFGWSPQKILNTYGPPTSIDDYDGGVQWSYETSSGSGMATFLFRQGGVSQIELYDS